MQALYPGKTVHRFLPSEARGSLEVGKRNILDCRLRNPQVPPFLKIGSCQICPHLHLFLVLEKVQIVICKVFLPSSIRLVSFPWEKGGALLAVHIEEDALLLLV